MGRPKVNQRGFTLIELVVTLLVLAIAVAVVTPAIGRSTEALRTRAQVARLTAMLRHAREQAITTGLERLPPVGRPAWPPPYAHSQSNESGAHMELHDRFLAVDMTGDDVAETRTLPSDVTIEASPPQALTVRFEPYGVSNGGDFRVQAGTVRYRVIVDGLTGRVKATRL